jgi:D-alanyl-D-alanine carboxypeptidase/D-alanyl-D-alanine-endopeptidase (penicillin-binding protein 4)
MQELKGLGLAMRNKKVFAAVVFCISFAGIAGADLAGKVGSIINHPELKNVQFSVQIIKADSGQVVYSRNANNAILPASNMKIITTAAALKYLGANYEYKTRVGLCGDTLVVIGSGDPLLCDKSTDEKHGRGAGWLFDDIAAKLKQNGVSRIKDIVIDTTVFADEPTHPNWPKGQLNQWYACEVCGLNHNDNCIVITVENTGGKINIVVEPKSDFLTIINNVTPTADRKNSAVGAYRNQEPNKIVIKGTCYKQEGPFDVAIQRPAVFFMGLLAENLAKSGIAVDGQLLEKAMDANCDYKSIAEYNTPISDCLARSNKNSLGLAAESLLKTISANANPGKIGGNWAGGRELVAKYLMELGIDKQEFNIDDGSGLSRENRLSANVITKVLLDVYRGRDWELYKSSLAVAGEDGTIGKYFKEQKYRGKILGKTGYIAGVKSFSGVANAAKGDYIFSILTNKANGKTRDAINDIAKAIIDSE